MNRYAIGSMEEIWVVCCYKFFEKYGFYEWYVVEKEDAFKEMMKFSNGNANPSEIMRRIEELYNSVGVKK